VGYGSFFAATPGAVPELLTGARHRGEFHVGELVKIHRMRPAVDVRTLGTLIDVGANRGQFSLTARLLNPGMRVIAVEPLPACIAHLESVIGTNGRVIPVAAGDRAGEVTFFEAATDKSSSTLPMTEVHRSEFPWAAVSSELTVRTDRLDAVVEPGELRGPTLLKLDVQGAELEALHGAEGLLPHVDHILVEVGFEEHYEGQAAPDDIVRHLLDRGFSISGVAELLERHTDGGVVQADLVFRRR